MRITRSVAVLGVLIASSFAALGASGDSGSAAAAPPPAAPDAVAVARAHVAKNAGEFGFSGEDVRQLRVSSVVPTEHNGLTHVYLQQRLRSIDVHNAIVNVAVRDGKVFEVTASAVASAGKIANDAAPGISDVQAAEAAAAALGLQPTGSFSSGESATGPDRKRSLRKAGISRDRIPVRLVYQLTKDGKLRLAWELVINQLDGEHWWQIRIDADTGEELDKNDWGDADSYHVFDTPTEAPSFGGRTVVNNPAHGVASPFGWHDTNGAPGPESTLTLGNNVSAYTDTNNDNVPDAGSQPDGGAGLDFDFPLDLTQAPSTYRPAAVTNLFYWNNLIHDVFYRYGFDEAAGNFQVNNYGRGGAGNDRVNAEAQDGGGTNNANFFTPPDGQSPRMQMYIWNLTNPHRDGDFDNGIIVHEYGHGISNRLTGGPATAGCLGNNEQAGEGWSDWLGLMLTQPTPTEPAGGRGVGTYALGQPTTGPGIRAQKYSTNMAINTMTYDTIKTAAIPHGVGTVWAQMLWEVTWALVDRHGYDPNLLTGNAGNNLAMQLVLDGMKLQPCSPGFVDSRNAIIAADQANNRGANQCLLWESFAKRGLGFSADQGSSGNRSDGTEAFDLPPACQGLEVTATDTPNPVEAGGEISYDFALENTSDRVLTEVRVVSTLGNNASFKAGSATCGGSYNAGTHKVTFPVGAMAVGATRNCSFTAVADASPWTEIAFESTFEPDLSAWTATRAPGTSHDWALTTTTPHSPPNAAFASDPAVVSDQRLTTATPIALTPGNSRLSFAHRHATEPGFDGGVVEISTDGGTTWADVGAGRFTQNGYTHTLATCCSNPLPGRQAFSGNSGSNYKTSVVDLSDFAGSSALIRFRLGSDNVVGGAGWWVDDVVIGNEVVVLNTANATATGLGPISAGTRTLVVPGPTVPEKPTGVTATPLTATTAQVSFTPGDDGGSPVTSYQANCQSTDGGTTRNATSAAGPITVTGLTTGKTYRCRVRATNAIGTGVYSAFSPAFVQAAAPEKPTDVTARAWTATSASVSFAAPGNDGGSPITSYQANCTSTDGGTTRNATGAASPIIVNNLTTDKTYRCRVRATNALGTGLYSAYSSTFVAENQPPERPTNVVGTAAGPTTAHVGFTPGHHGGSPITSYQANCQSTDGGTTRNATGTSSPITVASLTAGKTYRCRVRATNDVGTGLYSAFSPDFTL